MLRGTALDIYEKYSLVDCDVQGNVSSEQYQSTHSVMKTISNYIV